MKVVDQGWDWIVCPDNVLELIELAGRICYKSEDRIIAGSAGRFVKNIVDRGHHSVIEHAVVSVVFITDRGVTHELVRHRLASYSQESTRYCNYGSDHVVFIKPVWLPELETGVYDEPSMKATPSEGALLWLESMLQAESSYKELLNKGWSPEYARSVLPNSLKTEIIVTCNLREWLHIFNLRCSRRAHPQIRALMRSCFFGFKKRIPVIFDGVVF